MTQRDSRVPRRSRRQPPICSAYGSSTLADLMPGIGAHLGVPGCDGRRARLPAALRYVVVLIDGLGWHLVRAPSGHARTWPPCSATPRPITAGVPSTTVTSLASLGTGLPPGPARPGRLHLAGAVDRRDPQRADLGVRPGRPGLPGQGRRSSSGPWPRASRSSSVALERFQGSGLTEAALRGAEFVGFQHEHDRGRARSTLVGAAATRAERSLVYAYERELDHAGHVDGCGSPPGSTSLAGSTRMCERLREALPDDVRLVITGDHGMVDVPKPAPIVAEDEPDLMAGVSALAGEGTVPAAVRRPRPARCGSPRAGGTGSGDRPGCVPATRRSTRAGSARSTTRLRERYGPRAGRDAGRTMR